MEKSQCPKCHALEFVEVQGENEGHAVSYFECESCEFVSLDGPT